MKLTDDLIISSILFLVLIIMNVIFWQCFKHRTVSLMDAHKNLKIKNGKLWWLFKPVVFIKEGYIIPYYILLAAYIVSGMYFFLSIAALFGLCIANQCSYLSL